MVGGEVERELRTQANARLCLLRPKTVEEMSSPLKRWRRWAGCKVFVDVTRSMTESSRQEFKIPFGARLHPVVSTHKSQRKIWIQENYPSSTRPGFSVKRQPL
ncbi:hypothetical protein CIRG_02147 [Coccidioides immitis RMSCC 2394]|uniref:Uncharacterized protein n=1 Tax=Coccidioides immitis RMSCC 2394 TaxID=404692 RepID=A0A0J7AXB0_COCIT|nr:hypothetical protein CIRG_02147 [Coccidioides immitis RMSCC 2394]